MLLPAMPNDWARAIVCDWAPFYLLEELFKSSLFSMLHHIAGHPPPTKTPSLFLSQAFFIAFFSLTFMFSYLFVFIYYCGFVTGFLLGFEYWLEGFRQGI